MRGQDMARDLGRRSFLVCLGLLTLTTEWRSRKAQSPQPGYPATDIGFMKIAESVAWRVESMVFVFLEFDGARLPPALAGSLLSLVSFSALVVAAAHSLGFQRGPSANQREC